MATQAFNASDLGLVVGRKSATPTTVPTLITALRDTVAKWDELVSSDRKDGGAITAAARSAAKFASSLVTDHGADAEAVKVMVAERAILKASNDEVIAAIGLAPEAKTTKAKAA
jgi:hypothetical protein